MLRFLRAEEEFILFTHKKFFVDINHNLKYLISYIETYGEKNRIKYKLNFCIFI